MYLGLQTSNSWTRTGVTGNNFLGNGGTELNTTTSLYDLDWRNYDPVLGRLNQVDPLTDRMSSLSPYQFSFNNPTGFNDPTGLIPPSRIAAGVWAPGDDWNTGLNNNDQIRAVGGNGSLTRWSQLADVVSSLWNSQYGGGYWTPEAGTQTFSSAMQATMYAWSVRSQLSTVASSMTHFVVTDQTSGSSMGYSMLMSVTGDVLSYTRYNSMTGSDANGWVSVGTQSVVDMTPLDGSAAGQLPLISNSASNEISGITGIWGGTASWGAEEAARMGSYTSKAVKLAKVGGNVAGVLGFAPTLYNTAAKTCNGTVNTSDVVDFTASGSLLAAGFLVTNPIGLGVLAVGGLGYGIYRIGWGDDADSWMNENFGFNNKPN
jgi:RHS repeat-associated protein